MPSFRVAVLISGRGSNFIRLHEESKNYSICGLISNKKKAKGLEFAREKQIPDFAFSRKDFSSLLEQKKAIYSSIRELSPDLICLAGYMQILESDFVECLCLPGWLVVGVAECL